MPRALIASQGGGVYQVINSGNARNELFHKEHGYAAFVMLVLDAHERLPMRLASYGLTPNHFERLLWP